MSEDLSRAKEPVDAAGEQRQSHRKALADGAARSWLSRFVRTCKHWLAGRPRILTGVDLTAETLGVIRRAEDRVVLATGYLNIWSDLERAIREALARDVRVYCLVRAPGGSNHERTALETGIAKLRELGVVVHTRDRFHAKVYLNEDEVIVSSFNLVGGSQSSIEMGVHFRDFFIVRNCLRELRSHCPELTKKPKRSRHSERPTRGYCIGCGAKRRSFNPRYPFCKRCYASSDAARNPSVLPRRSCHACGTRHPTTLQEPFCRMCEFRR